MSEGQETEAHRKGCRFAWVSPRRSQFVAAGVLATALVGSYLLKSLLHDAELPLDEFSQVPLTMMEIPPVEPVGYELAVMKVVRQIQGVGSMVVIIVQPNIRRRIAKAVWVQKWNNMTDAPFRFQKACSCKLGNPVNGCHAAYFVGSSLALGMASCDEVPSLGMTREGQESCLLGAIVALYTSVAGHLSETPGHIGRTRRENLADPEVCLSLSAGDRPLPLHQSRRRSVVVTGVTGAESQQTLDSVQSGHSLSEKKSSLGI